MTSIMVKTMKNVMRPLVWFVIVIFIFSSCNKKGTQPVARIGDWVITTNQFKDKFTLEKTRENFGHATHNVRLKILNQMIKNELMLYATYQNNLDHDQEVLDYIERMIKPDIQKRLIEMEVIEPNIPESEIKQIYKNAQKKVTISEIFLKLHYKSTKEDKKFVEQKLQQLEKEIAKGVDFTILVQKYSMHKNTAKDKRRELVWSTSKSVDPVYQKAYSMKKNEISKPIKDARGFHIIKVIDITKEKVQPYDDKIRKNIREGLIKTKRKELTKLDKKYIDKLKMKYNVRIIEDNVTKFINILNDETRKDTTSKYKENDIINVKFMQEELNLPIITLTGKEIKLEKILQYFYDQYFDDHHRPYIKKRDRLDNYLKENVCVREVLNLEAIAKNVRNDKEIQETLKQYKETFMINKIQQSEIANKISMTEEQKINYFETHKEDFIAQELRKVQEILVSDKKLADTIALRARSGENFTELAKAYNERISTKNSNGIVGYVHRKKPILGVSVFQTELHGIAGPIKNLSKYSIIKILEIKEAKNQNYEQSKDMVELKLYQELTNERKKEWLDQLKDEIGVTIYENRLDNLFLE